MLRFRLLGTIQVDGDGGPVALGGPKARALLAMLLLDANAVVSRDRLIEGLWGERAPSEVGHALDVQVSALRRTLAAGQDGRLVRRSPGYVLTVQPGELDLDEFEALAAEGCRLRVEGRERAAADVLGRALDLWRGPPLADVMSVPFAAEAARRLEERRLATVEDRVEAHIADGGGHEQTLQLEGLVAAHPFRERLVAALAVALYRAGRQAAALETIAAARRRFAVELGLDVGPGLRDVERRILGHDPSLAAAGRRSAPRRARSRRSWLGVAVATVVAAVAGFAVATAPSRPDGSPAPTGAALFVVDPRSATAKPGLRLAARPSAVAATATGSWVTEPDENQLVHVDRAGRSVVARVPVASGPGGLAVADGSVWVASELAGLVSRVDPATDRVTQRIRLGGHATAIAAGGGRVWVVDDANRRLTRLNAVSGTVERSVALEERPTAVLTAFGVVWVASHASGTVTAFTPDSMTPLATVTVGGGPASLAAGAGSVWVANSLDGTVARIDPDRPRVRETLPVGSGPAALTFAAGALWVADASSGTLVRVAPNRATVTARARVGARPTALIGDGSRLLVAAQPLAVARGGGTLTLLARTAPPSVDPAQHLQLLPPSFLGLVHDGLVTYQHSGGPEGSRLVPDLALSLPEPAAGATVFHFRLRPKLRYSTGVPVRASDFRRAFERLFRTGSPGAGYYTGLVGASRCRREPQRCRLARGVITDDAAGSITFRLTSPDPDFVYRLAAMSFAAPVPPGTPQRDTAMTPVPGTGPYRIVRANRREIRFERNPLFHEWSHAAQPAGIPDRIMWRFGLDRAAQIRAVQAGTADWMFDGIPAALMTEVRNHAADRLRVNAIPQTDFAQLNTRVKPLDEVRVRRALNLALDRRAVARLYGTRERATPTCQLLPPGLRSYHRYCPYTRDPRPNGAWAAPDVSRARRLIAASGTTGARVTLWSFTDNPYPSSAFWRPISRALRQIGLRVRVLAGGHDAYANLSPGARAAIGIIPTGWYADYPSPSNFYDTFIGCRATLAPRFYCDRQLDRQMHRARALESSDSHTADALWSRIDRETVDRAAIVPLANPHSVELLSPRLHNYQYNPFYGFLASQAVVR